MDGASLNDESRYVLVTRNTEYHMRGDVCVAVRDCRTREWRGEHPALHQKLRCAIHVTEHGSFDINLATPQVGERLIFDDDVVTSPLVRCDELPAEEPALVLEHAGALLI